MSDLGEMLRERRLMIPLTLRKLATDSGVSVSYLTRIERGERFPSGHILRKIAKPLKLDESLLMAMAGYLSPRSSTTKSEPDVEQLDPYVAKVLSEEPVDIQRTVIGILTMLKCLARVGNSAGWPEFREYVRRKYPDLDEDLITMIEDLIERSADKEERG